MQVVTLFSSATLCCVMSIHSSFKIKFICYCGKMLLNKTDLVAMRLSEYCLMMLLLFSVFINFRNLFLKLQPGKNCNIK